MEKKKSYMQKHISMVAEWCKFQNGANFSSVAPSNEEKRRPQIITSISVKPLAIVHGFRLETEKFAFGKKTISSERVSQEEQNGANVSFLYSTFQ